MGGWVMWLVLGEECSTPVRVTAPRGTCGAPVASTDPDLGITQAPPLPPFPQGG